MVFKMNETSKIRDEVIQYCQGCGFDLGCGDEKISKEAIGIDSGEEWDTSKNLSCVNIKEHMDDLMIFNSNSFDYAYSSHLLEHLKDPEKMILEMCRVVKPGGHVVIYLPDKVLYTEDNTAHLNMWSLDDFIRILPENTEVVKSGLHSDYSFVVVFKVM